MVPTTSTRWPTYRDKSLAPLPVRLYDSARSAPAAAVPLPLVPTEPVPAAPELFLPVLFLPDGSADATLPPDDDIVTLVSMNCPAPEPTDPPAALAAPPLALPPWLCAPLLAIRQPVNVVCAFAPV